MNAKEKKKQMRQEMRQIAHISNLVVLIIAVKALFAQSCLTLCGPMDCTQPTRLLCLRDSAASDTGLVATSVSGGSSRPRDGTCISRVSGTDRRIPYCLSQRGFPRAVNTVN